MFASIEVLIGLALVYLLLALIVTALTEWQSSLMRFRSRNLHVAIRQMLDGPDGTSNTERFFAHPRIIALSEGKKPPSYIPSQAFAEVVKDLADSAKAASPRMPLIGNDVSPTVAQIEDRFLDTMNRASGWYKRKAITWSLIWATAVVVVANADTLEIGKRLWRSTSLRAAVVAQAERRVAMGRPTEIVPATYANQEDPVPAESDESAEDQENPDDLTTEDRDVLETLLGWNADFRDINDPHCEALQVERDTNCLERGDEAACDAVLDRIAQDDRCVIEQGALVATDIYPGGAMRVGVMAPLVISHLFGWLLSVAAVSLGAPFWFDTLSRFINIRGAGPAEKPKNKGDDRSSNEEKDKQEGKK
jgi:hypothetical protein